MLPPVTMDPFVHTGLHSLTVLGCGPTYQHQGSVPGILPVLFIVLLVVKNDDTSVTFVDVLKIEFPVDIAGILAVGAKLPYCLVLSFLSYLKTPSLMVEDQVSVRFAQQFTPPPPQQHPLSIIPLMCYSFFFTNFGCGKHNPVNPVSAPKRIPPYGIPLDAVEAVSRPTETIWWMTA